MKNFRRVQRSNVAIKALPTLFYAGRAVLTFQNQEAGTHITVKISQQRDKLDRKILLPRFKVGVKLLGDRVGGFVYAGMIFADTDNWSLSNKVDPTSQLAQVFNYLHKAVKDPEILRGKVSLFHEGHCCRCGLPLTHPESINTAIGPKCLHHMMATQPSFKPVDLFETAQ